MTVKTRAASGVQALTNPVTGGIKVQAPGVDDILGGVGVLKARNKILSRCPFGQIQSAANYGGYTTHIQAALAGVPIAVRVLVPNLTAATPTIAGSFGFDTTPGAVNSTQSKGGNVATWNNLTFSGSASATHTATVSASQPTWVASDWIGCAGLARTDGVAGSIIHIRLIQGAAAAAATWFLNQWAASATTEAVATQIWRGYRSNAANDYATTAQASFPGNSGNAVAGHVPCVIQYMSIIPGTTMLLVGDSISAQSASAGVLTANGYGWASRARDLMSSAKLPVEVCNLGWPGQTMAQAYVRFADVAAYFSRHLLFHMAFSPNDFSAPATSGNITGMKTSFGKVLAVAYANDLPVVYQTGTPANALVADGGSGGASAKSYTATDSLRVAYNAELTGSNAAVFDVAAVVSGAAVASGNAAGQIEYNQTLTTDGLHPNDAGYAAWASALATYLKPLL